MTEANTYSWKLDKIQKITGTIHVLTGLRIGGSEGSRRIGGVDSPVVKNPLNDEPYIPGSSLKGKIRSLLELKYGIAGFTSGKVLSLNNRENCPNQDACEKILQLFGSGADVNTIPEAKKLGPTRAIFSDCFITKTCKKAFGLWGEDTSLLYTEVKAENSINRITSTAENPRFIERILPGVEFNFSISFRHFVNEETGTEKNKDLINLLLEGFALLELDYLGGNGSRGYGKVKFKFDNKDIQEQYKGIQENLFNGQKDETFSSSHQSA